MIEPILILVIGFGLVAIGFCFAIVVAFGNLSKRLSAQSQKIAKLEDKRVYKDLVHAEQWNEIWRLICQKFNIQANADGTWVGGAAAVNILNLMRAGFGSFSPAQMTFMEHLVNQIALVQEDQEFKGFNIDRFRPSSN